MAYAFTTATPIFVKQAAVRSRRSRQTTCQHLVVRCAVPSSPPPSHVPAYQTWVNDVRAALGGAALCCLLTVASSTAFPQVTRALSEPQKLVAEAWRIVDQSYVDRTFNNNDWFKIRMKAVKHAYASMDEGYSAIRDMLGLLQDPYTRFLTPEQYSSLTSSASGDLAGVGVEMLPTRVEDKLIITTAVDNSPAERAGVLSNDVLTLVDGEDVSNLTPDEAAARIRGSPGTSVQITVVRDRGLGAEVSMDLRRESLKLKTVKHEMIRPEVGYVRIKQFNTATAEDMRAALVDLQSQHAAKYVVDLRNNPGGYFPAGVDVARLFFKGGQPIVFVVDKNGISDEMDSAVDGIMPTEPLVVLVNKATASASEILAGALQDSGRARLVGQQTFGKGVVQTVTPLSDGSGLAVTIARYETPAHKNINKIGITPDIKTDCAADAAALSCLPEDYLM
jgi:carboxyl-terminal processing protease